MKRVILRAAAAADIEVAYRWYERQRHGLGDEFLAAVRAAIQTAEFRPLTYPVLHRDTRRVLLRRFPYGLFYRIVDNDLVVVACFHARRKPRQWESRS